MYISATDKSLPDLEDTYENVGQQVILKINKVCMELNDDDDEDNSNEENVKFAGALFKMLKFVCERLDEAAGNGRTEHGKKVCGQKFSLFYIDLYYGKYLFSV